MKKILIPILLGATVLTLASCDDESTQTVSYVDANGDEQTVELKATDDEEVVDGAIAYTEAADYSSVEGVSATLTGELDISYTASYTYGTISSSGKATFKGSGTGTISEKDDLVYGNLSGSYSQATEYNSTTISNEYTLSGNLYADLTDSNITNKTDTYVYIDYDYTSKTNSNSNNSAKGKFSYDYLLELLDSYSSELDDYLPSTSESDSTVDSLEDFDAKTLFDEVDTLLNEDLKNSNIVISEVNNDTYTLKLNLSYNDLMTYAEEENHKLDEDIIIECSFVFDVKTGLFKGFNISTDLASTMSTSYSSTSYSYSTTYDKCYISFNADVSYTNITVKTLTSEEKANYELVA